MHNEVASKKKRSKKFHHALAAGETITGLIVATALVNATPDKDMTYAGKGFIDTSRIASGPPNIWSDILLTNSPSICKGIDKVIKELTRLKEAVHSQHRIVLERLLYRANQKRTTMINHKIRRKELL